jgi:hypothetical protein
MEAGWVPKKLGNTPIAVYLSINAAYWIKGIQMIKSIRDCFRRELLAQQCPVTTWHFRLALASNPS